ncbi:MAG: thioredoxin domain-containing protein [Anaplasmataceae bacterium]|nr:thioredoxin domain-containing protein [Anaplasmataceae bacterium]
MENNNSPYLIPGAIVIAGLLIAGAVFLNGDGFSLPKTNPSQEGRNIIKELGINEDDLKACNESGRYMAKIDAHINDAITSGGTGTPYNVVLLSNGQKIPLNGAQPYENMKQIVNAVLPLGDGEKLDTEGLDLTAAEKVSPVSDNDHLRGSPNAKLTIIEFSDLECPFCATFHETMERIMSEYETQGTVAWVYRHFPLESIHPDARRLAHEAECVNELAGNDAFWKYLSSVFEK